MTRENMKILKGMPCVDRGEYVYNWDDSEYKIEE